MNLTVIQPLHMQDLVYAWRSLRATWKLTIAASACAAVGLGAAIFMTALVNAVLFATPTMPDAHRLVRIWTRAAGTQQNADVSYPEVADLKRRARSFDAVESASRTRLALTTDAGTERLRGESVTPGYFSLIGVRPAVGRLFDASEYLPNATRPVVISHDLWQRRFGGRADIVGQLFRTRPTSRQSAGNSGTIVGVMPPGFVGTVDPDVSDFWLPISHYEPAPHMTNRTTRSTWVIARLAPGVSFSAARSEVDGISAALTGEFPAAYDRITLAAEPFGETWRERFRLSLITLLAATGLLLLIACTNIATLLLARLVQRESELRVRLALGAQPSRIRRQLLAESLMIALAGGAAGLALAAGAIRLFAASRLFDLPSYVQISAEPRVVMVGFALVVLTGLLFGVVPARLGAGASVVRDSGFRVSMDRRQRRYGRGLVVAQVAFTFVLLAGAALLFRTHQQLVGGDLGFRTDRLLRMAVSPDRNVFPDAASQLALAADIKRTFDAYPGVAGSAVLAGVLPPWFDDAIDVDVTPTEQLRDVGLHAIGPDFLAVMGMRLVGGREFGPSDRAEGATSAIVSESLAARLGQAAGRDVIGQQLRLTGPQPRSLQIIGIVNDIVYNGPLRKRPADHDIYVPLEPAIAMSASLSLAIETDVDPASLIEPLSRALGTLAPTSPQHWISTMEAELALQYRDARLYAMLSGVFGAAAALLAALGIYSVLANNVARRQREIGVRLAVGARGVDIARLILTEGARTLLIGVTVGTLITIAASRLIAGLLYGVRPGDPVTLAVVAASLVVAGLLASALPARRAARVDPLTALRRP